MNDGGPAFPGQQEQTPEGYWNQTWSPGMSQRQWYKGKTLQGLLSNVVAEKSVRDLRRCFDEEYQQDIAAFCGLMADAMIKEDEK